MHKLLFINIVSFSLLIMSCSPTSKQISKDKPKAPTGTRESTADTGKLLTTSQSKTSKDTRGSSAEMSIPLTTSQAEQVQETGESTNPELQSDQPSQRDLTASEQQELIDLYSKYTGYYDDINTTRQNINQSIENFKALQSVHAANKNKLMEEQKHLKFLLEEERSSLDKLNLFKQAQDHGLHRLEVLRSKNTDPLTNPTLTAEPDLKSIEIE